MEKLTKEERIKVMELTKDIASSVSNSPNLNWNVSSIEALIETTFNQMIQLIEGSNIDNE